MDAFYASVEQRDDPRLAGKPVIVGGTSGRGVVAAASYEVRRFGVRSAMPMRMALERCPHAICVRPRMQRYQEVSAQIFAVFREFTPLVQGLSLDEAYLDVTASLGVGTVPSSAAAVAACIKDRIRQMTCLTASVGVAPNRLVAKIASDLDKPDGLTVVTPERIHEVLDPLSVRRLPGLGRKTGMRVEALGIRTLRELRAAPDSLLWPLFGRYTQRVRDRASGIDDRPVCPDQEEKSISAEDTFEQDVEDASVLEAEIIRLADLACRRLRSKELAAACVAIKIRRRDFRTFTRQRAVAPATQDRRAIAGVAVELLHRWLKERPGTKLRLLGVALSDLSPATQLALWDARTATCDRH